MYMLDTGVIGYGSHEPVALQRRSVESLIATLSGAAFDLYPLQGLFACQQQGCLAEFHLQQNAAQTELACFHIACIRNAARRFLASHEQGALFIDMPMRALLNRAFRFRLSQFIQQDARLYGRLVLLLQAGDLCSSSACAMALKPACRELSIAGVQFGVHVLQVGDSSWVGSTDIRDLAPSIVVHYSDTLTQDHAAMQSLAKIIRSCRTAGWPLLADYRNPEWMRRMA